MGIRGSIRARWQVLGLAYNQCETRDKQPLGSDLDRSSCHCHASVKLFWSQPIAPWKTAACHEFLVSCRLGWELSTCLYASTDAHGVMGCDEESFIILIVWQWHQLLSGSLPNGRLSQVSCWLLVRPRTFHLAHILPPMPMESWATTIKSFIILVVWQWHQLLSGSLTNGHLSRVSHRLGQEFFTLPSKPSLEELRCYSSETMELANLYNSIRKTWKVVIKLK